MDAPKTKWIDLCGIMEGVTAAPGNEASPWGNACTGGSAGVYQFHG